MTPPRNYKDKLEEYISRQQGMWAWISLDPLNRDCKDYHKKFAPHLDTSIDNFACDYAEKVRFDDYDRCESCFLDSNFQKCTEIMSKFSTALHNKDEETARQMAWEFSQIQLKEDYK